jgi:uncharacterized membrane protein (DUF2068 family)
MDWSLLGCGARGHITFAPDEPELRERIGVTTPEGAAWRCLRCGTFVIGEPGSGGPVSAAPRVRRGNELRSAFILRLFAVERFVRALIFGALAIAIWRFSLSRLSIEAAYDQLLPALRSLLRELGFNVNHSKLLGLIQHAFKLNPHTLGLLALAAGAYAVIEIIEGVGLWLLKRWGEYFAMIATSVGIPYEIYDLTAKVTWLRLVAFAINVALVVYLVVTKRLFGVRGGKKAYEARLRSASILQAEIDAVAASPGPPHSQPGQPGRAEAPDQPEQPAAVPAAGVTDQPTGPPAPGRTDPPAPGRTDPPAPGRTDPPAPGRTDAPAPGRTDLPRKAETARGPNQPTDAAATNSSAAE